MWHPRIGSKAAIMMRVKSMIHINNLQKNTNNNFQAILLQNYFFIQQTIEKCKKKYLYPPYWFILFKCN